MTAKTPLQAEHAAGSNRRRQVLSAHYPQIMVLGIVLAAIGLDYAFRSNAWNYYDRGYSHFNNGKLDAAAADFNRLLRQNPSDPAAHFALGYSYHRKGWSDEALRQYDLAGPSALEVAYFSFNNAGVLRQNKGDLDGAAAAYSKALQVNPGAGNSLHNLALIYEARGQYDALLKACQRFLETTPQNAEVLDHAGIAAEKLGNRDLARQYYREALAADPNFAPARTHLDLMSAK